MKRKELRQHSNDGLIDYSRLMLQYILTFVLQLGNYIPRPDFTGIMQRIRNGFTELGSLWLSQKNWKDRLKDRLPVVVIDVDDANVRNEVQEQNSKVCKV